MKKTKQNQPKNMASIDRLSALPNNVICHILSFLPTHISISTGILAKRWRYLWAHVPDLDFHSDHADTAFSRVVNRVMLLHKVESLNSFRLVHNDDCRDYELETWIIMLSTRCVRKIDICCYYQVTLPQCLFTCETLVDLRLGCCGEIRDAGSVYLPALKKLHLDFVTYESRHSLSHLLSGCPLLEELIINAVTHVPCICISSPTLVRLELSSDLRYGRGSCMSDYLVNIDAPALQYLVTSEIVSILAQSSLTEANIFFGNHELVNDGDFLYASSVFISVVSLCNVRCLKLSTRVLKVCDWRFSVLTTTIKYPNLTKLELAADGRFLSYFLGNADNLEVLVIRKYRVQRWEEPHPVPTCLISRLQIVTIDEFRCSDDEFELIRYLLLNGKVMRRLEICFEKREIGEKEKKKVLERISSFQRGSEACELIVD